MLKKLYLYQFRNYTREEFSFSPGVNWIVGKNAQGKTNLLEAIYLLTTGRSFRTCQLRELIQEGSSHFFLEAEIEKEGVTQILKLSFDGETKRVDYNHTSYSHFTPLIGLLPHVIYAPDDIALVSGAPAFRRKFLNLHLSQIDPLYLHHLVRFHKAMRQRNELLKQKTETAIEPWEETMSISASYLVAKRSELISALKTPLSCYMNTLSGGQENLEITYAHSLSPATPDTFLAIWNKSRKKELHLGATLHGPHRDDVIFTINGFSSKSYASMGQKHTILAALRLCEWKHFENSSSSTPLLGIDDFGAHLDEKRQNHFQEALEGLGQIFLTSPSASVHLFPQKRLLELSS